MNGFAPPAPATGWAEYKAADGRLYYHNAALNETTWTKPEELMAPAERALANQPWKEYTAEGGRKYWYNTETKTSSWEMPEAYRKALGFNNEPSFPLPATPRGNYQNGYDDARDSRDTYSENRQIAYPGDPKALAFVPASNDPEYDTPEEAEAAFFKLMKKGGVQHDWTWVQAVRATARDPQYFAIKTASGRRAAFEKYCDETVVQSKERAKERMAKLRADFETMLRSHPEIIHYTRWKTARPILEGETLFRSTQSEEERRQLFDEHIASLRKSHAEQQLATKKSATDGLIDLLSNLVLEPYIKWHDFQEMLKTNESFQNEEKYRSLPQADIQAAFQNHIKALERAWNDKKQEEKNKRYRKERKARDAFKALLAELRDSGQINAGTKWSQINITLIKPTDAYLNMVGQPGTTPMELFWDVIEEEERKLRGPRNHVLDVLEVNKSPSPSSSESYETDQDLLQDKRYDLTLSTDFDEFLSLMREDRRTANIDGEVLRHIFDRLREKRASRREDDKQPDRQQRHAIDDFRSLLRRMDPPLTPSDTYEKLRPILINSKEYQAVSSDEWRRGAFDKQIRRLKEREEDNDRREKRRERVATDGDHHRRERDPSRGERSHRSSGRRRTRSPEVDAYEADRRKAVADRERNYRKSAGAESLLATDRGRLSPPPRRDRERERERVRDRERDYDRPPRPRRDEDSHYDQERRDREEERERRYRSRTERDSYDELNYGEDRPSAPRRRRPDDEDDYGRRDARDAKRPRTRERSLPKETRERKNTSQPAVTATPKDVHSGSEEGEIEEE